MLPKEKGETNEMKRAKTSMKFKKRLSCPQCGKFRSDSLDPRVFGPKADALMAEPGDLTECEHCGAWLEYGDSLATLHPAPLKRVQTVKAFLRERPPQLELPKLLAYLKKYRRMPAPNGRLFFLDPDSDPA
jgi:hypothetical protein